jgi:hypothetical protein
MDPKELKRIFQRGKCLSLDTMRMYNEGKLPSKSVHEVEMHLLECSLCASAIEGMNARRIKDVDRVSDNINKRLAVYMNTPPQTPILSRFGVTMIVTSLVIAIGITAWILASGNEAPSGKIADTNVVSPNDPPDKSEIIIQNPDVQGERPQTNGVVSVSTPSESQNTRAQTSDLSISDLPATLPNNENTLKVDQPATENNGEKQQEDVSSTDNTRTASTEQFVRIKNVIVYPPTTHSDKKAKQQSGDGQLNRSTNTKGDFTLEEMPSYPGGNEALKSYITANFKPQKEDKSKLKRYTTGVLFQVNAKTGEVSGASLSFPITPQIDAELVRVVNAMPYWNPGKKRGTVDVMLGITLE